MLTRQMKERFQTNPAQFIEGEIKEFVRTSPLNHLPFINNYIIWDEPLVKFADGDDYIFTERKSNRSETLAPSRLWSHTRWYGEKFNEALREHMVEILTELGYQAVAPILQPYFRVDTNDKGPYSNWSERHIAYAAGHGTFSLSDGLITECGIAHRCGSVVTDLVLPVSLRITKNPYSNCLFYIDGSCKACINRCPAGAITEEGHNKLKCRDYQRDFGYSALKEYDNDTSIAGCGLCQTKVPCEFQNPTRKLKRKKE